MSFPPRTPLGCIAADVAHYISPQTPWTHADNWYQTNAPWPPLPPGVDRAHARWAPSSGLIMGDMRTMIGSGTFSDLSVCFYYLEYPTAPHDPSDSRVQRRAWYTNKPEYMDAEPLVRGHNTYGEDIASFAESYQDTGVHVTNGECWSLASEAIKVATERHPGQMPIPSMSRMHGHLIYCGKPGQGRWRGGDTQVRRGDIVEWRTARIDFYRGNFKSGYSTLGDPEHTAVIVEDCVPRCVLRSRLFNRNRAHIE